MRTQPFAYIQSGGANPPTVTTTAASAIEGTTATCGGNVTSDGGGTVTARGVVWSSATENPTIELSTKTVNGSGLGVFTSNITGLSANTTYYARSYATNSAGTAYGSFISFTTDTIPSVTTTAETAIGPDSVTLGGNVTDDGRGSVTSRGIVWSNSTSSPTVSLTTKTVNGSGLGTFTATAQSLLGDTTHYIRAYATNGVGTAYGNTFSFFKSARAPSAGLSLTYPAYNPNTGNYDAYQPPEGQACGQSYLLSFLVFAYSNGNGYINGVTQYGYRVNNGSNEPIQMSSRLNGIINSGDYDFNSAYITAVVGTPVTLQAWVYSEAFGYIYTTPISVVGLNPNGELC